MEEIDIIEYFLENDLNLNNVIQVIADNAATRNILPDRTVPVVNEGYMKNIIPNYSLSEFKMHFRMTRGDTEELCILLSPHIQQRHLYVSFEKVLFFIWVLAKQESFLAVSDRFGLSKSTGHYIFMKILSAIIQIKENFIQWPNQRERYDISSRIEQKCSFPGVVGAIDGCHINIKQPLHNLIDFYNRKGQHSVILQAVCDDKMIFTDVFAGMPGRMHDARVFRHSPLYQEIVGNPAIVNVNQHIIIDAAYPLLQNVLTPFRDNGHLTVAQIRFNEVLSTQRSTIERAFAQLKGKWRRLKFLDMSIPDKVPEVILAACILHNFILKRHEEEENYGDLSDDENGDVEIIEADVVNNSGVWKRQYIMTLLQQND